jgi:hypothetical protein
MIMTKDIRESGGYMERLSVDFFITDTTDLERKQYLLLHALKGHYQEFSRNCLYPSLAELIDLTTTLNALLQQQKDIRAHLPKRLKGLDIKKGKLMFESPRNLDADIERIADFIVWSLTAINRCIDEGMNIYNFVEEHIAIEEVGIMPMYREEGYWFVPDVRAALLHLLRYEVSLYTSATERYRTLRTRLLDSIEEKYIARSPESLKLELIDKYQDLPNPATYRCEVDLEFPYAETILPIAKRKLMKHLFS